VAGARAPGADAGFSATPLAERLGTRIAHILVDEFQDTSRDQYELLRTLTQDWSEGDGRTLFVVGDPMQSIYGFRNAEVGRFSTVARRGLARSRCSRWSCGAISVSAPALVHWCNESSRACSPSRRRAPQRGAPSAQVAARADLEGAPHLYRVDMRLRTARRGAKPRRS
jgi:hypothetical protein